MRPDKVEKKIKRLKLTINIAIGLAFFCMIADMMITRNFFIHTGELLIASLLSFGFAIFLTYKVNHLNQQLKECKS